MKLARKLRYVPQLERTECGAAALAMVLDYHGNAVPLSETRAACAVSRDGVSAARIVSAATQFGLRASGLRLAAAALPKLRLPAILHWESSHFVVLEQLGKRDAVVVDPARGRRRISLRALCDAFSGVALVFERTPSTPARLHRSGSLRRYWSALVRERCGLAFVAGCTLLLQLLALVGAASTQVVIDRAVGPGHARWLLVIGLLLALAALLRGVLGWLRARVLINLQSALDVTLQSGFVRHLLELPLAFFAQRAPGDLMQRVAESAELCSISRTLSLSALDGLLLLAYAALMLAYDLRLGLAVLALSFGRVLAARLLRAALRQATEEAIALGSRERATCIDTLSAMEMMRALAAESALVARYRERAIERLNAELSLKRTEAALQTCLVALDGAGCALVLWLGGRAVLDERMTVGVLAGFLTLSRLLDAPLAALLRAFESYLRGQSTLARVDDVLASAPAARGRVLLSAARGEVAFQGVSFRHGPSSPWLFRNLSFRVRAGEKVVIVGRSGAGKSTLLQLLLGALTPTSGTITIDGVPIDELDRQGLARCLGAVLQEPFLLDDTVEHNLRLRVPDATHEALVRAAESALAHELILALPQGYRTRLGGDVQLSGGQRQRLAIARALVGRPRVLLLDEATSSLDRATEAALHENLGRLDCTRILVAHRLATVRDADRILVLENGQIAQQGSYRELTAAPGLLRELEEAAA